MPQSPVSQDHRRIDTAARKDVLKTDAQGLVVAPQHIFLGPDGKVRYPRLTAAAALALPATVAFVIVSRGRAVLIDDTVALVIVSPGVLIG